MGFLHEFFPSGPPQPAECPSDDTVVHHIRTLVQYAAKNGPSFMDLIRKNQSNNLEYSFAFQGDPAYPFFLYSLWQEVKEEEAKPPPPPPPPPRRMEALSESSKENWMRLLSQLNGSELSIKKCQGWFMSFAQYASELCSILVQEAIASHDADHTVNLIHLIDDILQRLMDSSCSEMVRKDVVGAFGAEIPRLVEMSMDGLDESQRKQLLGIVQSWDTKQIFDPDVLKTLLSYLERDPHYFDSLSVPASLIPQMCRESLEVYPPYSPLDPEDVKTHNITSSSTIDEYLEARIKSFYDVVGEYRPGLSVDDLHVGIPKLPTFQRTPQPSYVPTDDGSYQGGRAGNAKGLGYGKQEGSDGAFDMYRRRSKYSSYKANKGHV
eukprot:jgi/Picre1/32013/NNA_007361.t1